MRVRRTGWPCLAVPLALGCAGVRVLDPGSPNALAPDEGVLVLQIDTEIPVADLRFGRLLSTSAVSKLAPGRHLVTLAVREGRYRWTGLSFRTGSGHGVSGSLPDWDPLAFEVIPGRVNYIGEMQFGGTVERDWVSFTLRVNNRSGEIAPLLVERLGPLLDEHPLVFGGWHRDDYIERYLSLIRGRDGPQP